MKEIEYYRKLLAEYEIDINDPEAYEDIMSASEERLTNWAIRDAINYWEKQKKEPATK